MNAALKSVHRPCPVCDTTSAHVLHHQRFALPAGHPLPSSFDIVACPVCDSVYADTPADAAAYDRYYADYSKYADQGTSTGGGGDLLDQARIQVTAQEIARHLPDKTARIVDIGCANGGMLAALRNLGYDHLLGIDPSPECVTNTRRLFDIPAQQSWLGALPADAAPADLVILSHVLEHVLDLADAVVRIRPLLAPGGLVYIEVPDASRYAECLAAPFQDFNTEHINHFSLSSLANLFAAHGFELIAEGSKAIPMAGGLSYPACFGVFRSSSTRTRDPNWRRAPGFLKDIHDYITLSTTLLARIDTRLAGALNGPVIVWGAGQLTLKLLLETRLGVADIVAFTDGNPLHHGKTLHDRLILAPADLRDLPPHPIVIGSLLHHAAIAKRIREELCLPNPVVTLA
jgi:SAM-dependent methyltransferase